MRKIKKFVGSTNLAIRPKSGEKDIVNGQDTNILYLFLKNIYDII